MGVFTYVTETERKEWTRVKDEEVQEVFNTAKELCPSLLITYRDKEVWGLFKNKIITYYDIYHDDGVLQARLSFAGSGTKRITMAYLYGIINGAIEKPNIANKPIKN